MPLPLQFDWDERRIERGAQQLLALRRRAMELEELPDDCTPRTIAEAQAIHDRVSAALGWPILGWKYYLSYKAQEKPLRTAIYNVLTSPAAIDSAAISPLRLIEPEIVFRLLRDLSPRAAPYRYDEVAAAVECLPAFEVIGHRFSYPSHAALRQRIAAARRFDRLADHNSCGAIVCGAPCHDWREVDWWALRVTMRQGQCTLVDCVGGHPFVEPFLPILLMANDFRQRQGLKAGQVLVTSSYSGFYQVERDTPIVGEFAGFEPIEAVFK